MNKIKISTDSTADIPRSLAQKHQITILPLTIMAEGKEYLDGVDLTPKEFFKILENCTELPTSSQVSTLRYTELYENTWKGGYTHLIHTCINSKGSGTYQAAVLSRDMFYEEHPEAAEQLQIHLIDSHTYSMIYGMAVLEGAEMAENGAEPEEIVRHIQDTADHTRGMFVPMTLRFVRKSGRISAAAAFVGDAMGLKPAITFENGESKVVSKFRGDKRAIAGLMELVQKQRKPGTPYCVVYANNMELYEKMKELCDRQLDGPSLLDYPVGNIISINTGPDMIGIIYKIS